MTIPEYNKCIDTFSDNLYRFILKNLREEEDAQDIVQESFIKLWQNVKSVNFETAKSYLFTIAYRTMIDHIRKYSKFTITDSFAEESEEMQSADVQDIINDAVDKLPDIQKQVVLLRDYEGYSYEEIGEITGLSESQVKVYIFRARNTLKKYLVKLDFVI